MEWIDFEQELPFDDSAVFVINENVSMLPLKAYYCDESKEFISLESINTIPVSVTHWMPIVKLPE